ncbi:PRC-barrel domain containing protein [Tolypothrix campylonemoides VB511288]|nr:PRC-barrel domain containing protein [Tolypothrix campylonemoides VB511288]
MTSQEIIRHSDILKTQIITRDNGKQLGVVSQFWVDIDQRQVMAVTLRGNPIAFIGVPRYMYFKNINQIGDIILVDNEDVIEDIDVQNYSNLIHWEIITEIGEVLGRVQSFKFNGQTGKIVSIIIASLRLPQIHDQFLSTYELSVDEIVSTASNKLIVFEKAEERVTQLTVGLLERLGIGTPWERNKKGMVTHDLRKDDERGSENDDTGGSPPILSPRRPKPGPTPNDTAEQLDIGTPWERNKKRIATHDLWDDDEWGSENNDTGGSPPIPSS